MEKHTNIITPAISKVSQLFADENFSLRIVGGAVRDVLLGKDPKDIDLATDATPDQAWTLLHKAGYNVIATGLEHGTISVVVDGYDEPFEITTLRVDEETDGRHATVKYITDFKVDAERRDFTFNAMSIDMDGNLFDYFGGKKDLANDNVKFVGSADARIKEDYLRILRYVRFKGRMQHFNTVDADTKAITDNAEGLRQISVERVWIEVKKIIMGKHVNKLFEFMEETGVSEAVQAPRYNFGASTISTKNPVTRLAAMDARTDLGKYWKMSSEEQKLYTFLVKEKTRNILKEDEAKEMLVNGVSKQHVLELLKLFHDNKGVAAMLRWEVPTFPVSGKDLLNTGMKPGPAMGEELNRLKKVWVDSNFVFSKGELLGD